jgi:hypothetical protein
MALALLSNASASAAGAQSEEPLDLMRTERAVGPVADQEFSAQKRKKIKSQVKKASKKSPKSKGGKGHLGHH